MYCYEANKCNNEKCPVKQGQVAKCWLYFKNSIKSKEELKNKLECCKKCNYRLGWEIGLISESLFENSERIDAETLVPEDRQENTPCSLQSLTQISNEKRFCYEIVDCHNEHCPVREQQIFRCFKFFEPKGKEEKEKTTCCNRDCKNCFYYGGWKIGVITEEKFQDIIEKKKIVLEQKVKHQNDLIVDIYMNEISKKPLTHSEEMQLAQKIAGDKKASELFLMANLKLVSKIAKNYSNKMPLMDLIQEGNIGLIKAIAKFDYRLGYKFSTYAAYWVKYYMQRAVSEQSTSITIPCHLMVVANKIKNQIKRFEAQLSRKPTLSELSQILHLQEDKIINVINITRTPISIHTKVTNGEDEEETIEYYLEDKNSLTPEEIYFEKQKSEAIAQALTKLNDRQRQIVTNYYGINCPEITLADLGREMGISRERARQLLQQSLTRLQEEESILQLRE